MLDSEASLVIEDSVATPLDSSLKLDSVLVEVARISSFFIDSIFSLCSITLDFLKDSRRS